jgi:tetratricopeptide (TPR) repeat protein
MKSLLTPSRMALAMLMIAIVAVGSYRLWQWQSQPSVPVLSLAATTPDAQQVQNVYDYYREAVRRNPKAAVNYVRLAGAFMQAARLTGQESTYLPPAQALLDEALALDSQHYEGRVVQASLYNLFHQFEQARDLANALIAENDHHAATWGILVDAHLELGAYDDAVQACDRMLAIRPDMASYTRASYLRELHGDNDGAIQAMRMAADAGVHGREDRAWALYNLGQLYLAGGKPDTAAFIFNGILEERPSSAYAKQGLAEVARLRGDYDAAVTLLQEAYTLEPRTLFHERLAEAYREAGQIAEAEALTEGILASFEAGRKMGENNNMEYADFLADLGRDLPEALRLAQQEVERRPNHLHALETYAWTLHHNGRSSEAVPYVEKALRMNNGDAMLHYRAGMIYAAAGQVQQATRQFRLALDNRLEVESGLAAAEVQNRLNTLAAN